MASILIIEDEEAARFGLRRALEAGGHQILEAADAPAAEPLIKAGDFDLVLTDVNLPGGNGIDLVRRLRADGFPGGIVVMTAYGSIDDAVRAMKDGADEYLQKPLRVEEVSLTVARLLERDAERRKLRLYERLERARAGSEDLIGTSPAWRQVVSLAERLAGIPLDAPAEDGDTATTSALPTVLILGETGTGKGLLARHLHRQSAIVAPQAPFVHVNCSALPPTLVEAELFGHEKGAFTDARAAREGLFEMAAGGTIFLDEIGDLPLELQAKLLTVIEEGRFRRVGGTKEKRVRVRVIAATNQDLERRVEQGAFRRDLLYRLNAFTLRLPPLRDRGEDAVLLARSMLDRFARRHGRARLELGLDAAAAIAAYRWPGNVRELINTIQRAAMLADGPVIGARDLMLPTGVAQQGLPTPAASAGESIDAQPPRPARGLIEFGETLPTAEQVERDLVIQALRHTAGNVSRAARMIGMQRSSFRNRIERYALGNLVKELARE